MSARPALPRATLLADAERLAAAEIVVEGDEHRHLFRARRLAPGDAVRVVDGAGGARHGRVTRVDRRRATIALGDRAAAREPARRVELLVPLPRPPRAAWLVEKATELGVAAIRFVAFERAPRALEPGTRERLERVARAAVEQCGRARLPAIDGVHAVADLATLVAGSERRFRLEPGAPPLALAGAEGSSTVLVVGPEGGWSDDELGRLEELSCRAAGLGPATLRIETAALAAATLALAGS